MAIKRSEKVVLVCVTVQWHQKCRFIITETCMAFYLLRATKIRKYFNFNDVLLFLLCTLKANFWHHCVTKKTYFDRKKCKNERDENKITSWKYMLKNWFTLTKMKRKPQKIDGLVIKTNETNCNEWKLT
jgi:hypothetical protein